MTGRATFLFHDEYLQYQFGPYHPFQPIREQRALALCSKSGIFDNSTKLIQPDSATEDNLRLVHSERFIQFVKKMCHQGVGYLDTGDTPATKGLYEGALRVVGGSLFGAKLIMDGVTDHAFNPGGGLHHAQQDRASGFCVFNDIAIAIRWLQNEYGIHRIAVLDIDGHHGDGTQNILYHDPIMKISLHRIGIFPGTGYIEELGDGAGKGYSVNIPLQRGTTDDTYLYLFEDIVEPLLQNYDPEILITQFGVDGHYEDPLVGLNLTTRTYEAVATKIHRLAHEMCDGKLLIVGGGGYNIENTARCWLIMFATVSHKLPKDRHQYLPYFDMVATQDNKSNYERTVALGEKIKKTIFPFHGLDY
jgi:acetoin utilization protein AcuC